MKIGGLQKVSLIDYPGMISAIIFSQGCNFRCSYCHNPGLVDPDLFGPCIKEKDVLDFLQTRRGKLDAVAITGGEPTLQNNLTPFIRQIKKMGFAVKLDTNGSKPQVIKALLSEKLLDYIAMDIKAPLEKYEKIVNVPIDSESLKESIEIILHSEIPYEFRTTVVQSQLEEKDIINIAKLISGAQNYVLQNFAPAKTLDTLFLKEKSHPDEIFQKIKKRLEHEIPCVTIR
jgi:pyruvate formate lyase activating enzyme